MLPLANRFNELQVDGISLQILPRFVNVSKPDKVIKYGIGGLVFQAFDNVTQQKVAIKFTSLNCKTYAKTVYREFVLMNLVNHRNIIRLLNAYTPHETLDDFMDFKKIYYVMEHMDANLSQVIQNKLKLSHEQMSFLLYQMLCGINHLHKAGFIHGDLKPSSFVVNYECELKIHDFGLAGDIYDIMDAYVVTNYYGAPEVIFEIDYNTTADVWSIACIFAELISGRVLFPGANYSDQWTKIVEILGTPDPEFTSRLQNKARNFVESRPRCEPRPLEVLFPDSMFPEMIDNDLSASTARDLLSRMLVIDPNQRISVEDALRHPYVSLWYDPAEVDAPAPRNYDRAVELSERTFSEWKELIFNEIKQFEATHDIHGINQQLEILAL